MPEGHAKGSSIPTPRPWWTRPAPTRARRPRCKARSRWRCRLNRKAPDHRDAGAGHDRRIRGSGVELRRRSGSHGASILDLFSTDAMVLRRSMEMGAGAGLPPSFMSQKPPLSCMHWFRVLGEKAAEQDPDVPVRQDDTSCWGRALVPTRTFAGAIAADSFAISIR